MLNKKIILDKIEILRDNTIQVRWAKEVYDDGEILGQQFMRTVFHPGDDITSVDEKIQSICNLLWTPAVVEAYKGNKVK